MTLGSGGIRRSVGRASIHGSAFYGFSNRITIDTQTVALICASTPVFLSYVGATILAETANNVSTTETSCSRELVVIGLANPILCCGGRFVVIEGGRLRLTCQHRSVYCNG
ncbi:hypothetical protein F4776DRAFT_138642 [Hypoxylon sp. NC0597]|nr:hypothetical protein F4776DRAFT_138642 [Hypoxylon sp. NC0597]